MSTTSHTPSLTPSRSPTPEPPLQPDHFYGNEDLRLPPSPNSDGRTWLDPTDDPYAQRGIPVFKPSMDEFADFEGYMNKVEPWGMRSGIVKIIPPKEWTEALPSVVPQLDKVKLKNPIEQHMLGQGGLFQQQNIEKRRVMSVREWAEMCAKEDLRAPGVDDVGLHARATNGSAKRRTRRGRKNRDSETVEPDLHPGPVAIKQEEDEGAGLEAAAKTLVSPPNSNRTLSPEQVGTSATVAEPQLATTTSIDVAETMESRHPLAEEDEEEDENPKQEEADQIGEEDIKPKSRGRRAPKTREDREAMMAELVVKDREFLQSFDPLTAWLPPKTENARYTTEFCKELERRYWRNCGFGKPAWYGADMQGSLFTDDTTAWNVAHLPSALTRLLPSSNQGLPGVNTPYLYFGMWRATFAWHVEDMDLFSINYIHFGAPKFWYAMPQARANALEQNMRSLFPGAGKNCSQFLRHKSYLASPTLLSKSSCKPNYLVQRQGEFVITFPRGYHAGFNLGFNCAESVNFALESWIDIGRKAKACGCVNFSVRIDVDQLLKDRAAENRNVYRKPKKPRRIKNEPETEKENKPRVPRKRKSDGDAPAKAKKQKTKTAPTSGQSVASSSKLPPSSPSKTIRVTLKLPPKPKEPEGFPCCLCVSAKQEGLLRVQDPPGWWYEPGNPEAAGGQPCMAHLECASVVPETWVDEIEVGEPDENGVRQKESVVFGVDGIVKDRWNLKCTACTRTRHRAHGAPIQCTKGKCPKAFHVSCAREGHANGIVFKVVREVEKEVVLLDNKPHAAAPTPTATPPAPTPAPEPPAPNPVDPASVPIDPALTGEHPMDVDPSIVAVPSVPFAQPEGQQQRQPWPSAQVLKVIKKTEVEVLCHQHNPGILAAKKAQQQDRIRNQLLALPPMSRIKLRVTAGVFEVTLLRVLEETCSVEVLWDRGLRREFKWRSVVFGETDGVVGQKPSDPAEFEAGRSSAPTPTSVTGTVSFPLNESIPPPSYQPSPTTSRQTPVQAPTQVPSTTQSHPYYRSQHATPASSSAVPLPAHSTVYASQSPSTSSSSQQPAYLYRPPPGSGFSHQPPQHHAYSPRTSMFSYAPGSWTYPYSYQSGTHQYGAGTSVAGHPPAVPYPASAYVSTSYTQPGCAPPTSSYQYYPRASYNPYSHYGGHGYPPPLSSSMPPSASGPAQPGPAQASTSTQAAGRDAARSPSSPILSQAQAQIQVYVQAHPHSQPPLQSQQPSQAHPPLPTQALTQAGTGTSGTSTSSRSLQWQQPYTGPKPSASRSSLPPVPGTSRYYVHAPTVVSTPTPGFGQSGSRPGSANETSASAGSDAGPSRTGGGSYAQSVVAPQTEGRIVPLAEEVASPP
ncbi:hypothetical protein C8Q79DRAFT_299359 [Trametes meyenii]|nr:hypothetical protein C8Q79DRAFT_299359 [Trametes meyenii]